MSASRLRALGLMITLSWLFVGCSSPKNIDVGGACVLNSDCNQSLVCTWGKCHAACKTTADCPAGQSCITASDQSTVCQLPVEMHCVYNSDCQNPLTCAVDQRCHNQCQTSADCISGQTCTTTKTCAEPSEVDMHNNLIPADGGVSGSGGASGDAGFISPSPDASADRAADVLGSTGGTGGKDGAAGAGGSINSGLDASPDLFADVSASFGGIGGGGGITNTGAIVGAGGVTSTAGIIGAGGVTGSGGAPDTGGSTSPNSDASAGLPADAAGGTGDTPDSGDAPGTGGATNDGATSDATPATWADGPSASDSGAQVDAPRFITSFTASATTISAGSSVTLSWAAGSGATYVSIDNGVGLKSLSGSVLVFPTQTTTYILTATDGDGHFDTAQVTVTVVPIDASVGGAGGAGGSGGAGGIGGAAGFGGIGGGLGGAGGYDGGLGDADGGAAGLPVISSFVSGARILGLGVYAIDTGHATTLTATFSNATSAKVDPGFPSVTSGAAVNTGILTATTTYTLTVTNAVGPATATLTVEVLPMPVTVVSGQNQIGSMAVDSSSVYWTNSLYPPSVMKVSSAGGGTPVTLASIGQGYSPTSAIAIDSSSVYWTNYTEGTVMKVALAGGDTPATLASDQYFASAIAVDSSDVYWTTYSYGTADGGTNTAVQGTGSVMKVAKGGGDVTTLASGQDEPTTIAVDASSVYWNGYSTDIGGSLMKVAVGGGTPTTLAVGLGQMLSLALDANDVYWAANFPPPGGVMKLALTGGVPVTIAGTSGPNGGFAIDDTNVYWVDDFDDLMKVPLMGGTPVMLILQQASAPVVVDATSVYWGIGGTILKTAK
jgi:hypothetical protein